MYLFKLFTYTISKVRGVSEYDMHLADLQLQVDCWSHHKRPARLRRFVELAEDTSCCIYLPGAVHAAVGNWFRGRKLQF